MQECRSPPVRRNDPQSPSDVTGEGDRQQVGVTIIETGLGGRLDSTNVVTSLVSVMTPIGFDHMDRLGHTIAAIAVKKAGVVRPSVPVVIGARNTDARRVLTFLATQHQSPVRIVDRDFSFRSLAPAHLLDYFGLGLKLDRVELAVAGPFQHETAAITLAAGPESARLAVRGAADPAGASRSLLARAVRRGVAAASWSSSIAHTTNSASARCSKRSLLSWGRKSGRG